MRVIVIGSGVIGVATAYFLNRSGHEVLVLDRNTGPGLETNYANGALLTPSMSEPWNCPGSWRVLLGSLGRSDVPLQLHVRTLPGLASWGIEFLRNSQPMAFEYNALKNLRLALYSLQVMQSLREEIQIEYNRTARGALRLFRDESSLKHAAAESGRLGAQGLAFRHLSAQETVQLEPALAPIADQLVGSLHYETDEVGNAHRFCVALAELARQRGVQFRFQTEVTSLDVQSGRVTAAVSQKSRFIADRYVMAAGSYSVPLLRSINVHAPVQPVKGYSITIDSHDYGLPSLGIPVIDDQLHAVVVPLEGKLRVAGTAEFAGYDLKLRDARVRNLLALLRELFPSGHFDASCVTPWCGLRAMSADGVPIIGPTSVERLFLNIGHGHLGWTMAAGSARVLADIVSGKPPCVDPELYAFGRYAVGR